MMGKYDKMTDEEFDTYLESIVDMLTPAQILAIPGVYEALSEELNNEVLDAWAADHLGERDEEEDG